jgi:TolA-binding protein
MIESCNHSDATLCHYCQTENRKTKVLDQLRKENTELKERVEGLRGDLRARKTANRMYTKSAEARVTELETQLADRTYCHSDEAVEAMLRRYKEAASNAVTNAAIGPDTETDGITDCYHVPFDDLDALKELNSEEM